MISLRSMVRLGKMITNLAAGESCQLLSPMIAASHLCSFLSWISQMIVTCPTLGCGDRQGQGHLSLPGAEGKG